MALKIVRLAAADYRNGRRRCPQALPAAPIDLIRKLITRGSRRKSYVPAVTAQGEETPAKRQGEMERIVKYWKIFINILLFPKKRRGGVDRKESLNIPKIFKQE